MNCLSVSVLLIAAIGPAFGLEPVEPAVFRDVNILVVTDTHSWLAAHVHADQVPVADATIGNITNFVTTMKAQAQLQGKDVFFFDNGDVVDGTGLSNAAAVNGQELFPLLMEIPFDAMAIGNHELYDQSTLEEMISSGYMSSRDGSYLSSNVYFTETMEPLAARYVVLEGPNSGVRLLVFGVMYDMTDNTEFVTVETVESMVASDWFLSALSEENYDAIVLLAHMDYSDPLIDVLLKAIRGRVSKSLPIQFLTGHSHIRAHSNPDASSGNLEAGNYYNTIGYSSFDLPSEDQSDIGTSFFHAFYEPNNEVLAQILDISQSDMLTEEGLSLDSDVQSTRGEMGLMDTIGGMDSHYSIKIPFASHQSLYNLYLNEVAPSTLFTPAFNTSQILVTGTGLLRYDLFAGPVIVDDIWTMCPFSEPYYVLQSVEGVDLLKALALLNTDKYNPFLANSRRGLKPFLPYSLPNYLSSATPQVGELYDVIGSEWDASFIAQALGEITGTTPQEPVQYGDIATTELWLQWMSSRPSGP